MKELFSVLTTLQISRARYSRTVLVQLEILRGEDQKRLYDSKG